MPDDPAHLEDPLQALPHADPFRFLDRVDRLDDDGAVGTWSIRGDEDFLRGHFPGHPLVPGVLIVEAAAQLAGVAAARRSGAGGGGGMLVHQEARFKKPVAPPADIEIEVVFERSMGSIHAFEFTARHDGRPVALGTVSVSLPPSSGGPA